MRPRRNITRSSLDWLGSEFRGAGVVELLGGEADGGAGAGAGGFCATVTGTRSAIAIPRTKNLRMWRLINRCLGRKHLGPKILERMSVQVKVPNSNNRAAWMLRCGWRRVPRVDRSGDGTSANLTGGAFGPSSCSRIHSKELGTISRMQCLSRHR